MYKPAAIYARVSSDRQKENHTIASQTAALIEYAQTHGYSVPPEWVFQDEGYSGATLVRPGLEALRDLSAEGQIAAVLVYSPDRLSRKYAYQVLLSEELSRCGVELIFLKAPTGATPEDQLLVQFQGMIAEYERAQIAERCRRGKKHMAQQGGVNVLSGAPFGYRYVKKSDTSPAFYEVMETEAKVVRMVFEIYTQQGLSINAIARLLNERQIATRTGKGRWERSTVWGMLRNPAYRGTACYGKTEQRPRQRVTRPLRQRKALPSRDVGGHERPRADWIEVPVPALVSEEMFALAQEQLEKNKRHSPRHTIEPTLLQGLLVCEQCGYGLYRTSTHTSKQKLNYYRCIGSDGYRRLNGPVCTNRPIRQDYLDQFVWSEIIRLLEDPQLIQTEIDRRREAAQKADPLRKREEELRREQARVEKSSERLVTAYQEGLLTLPQLRQRMPSLQKQTQALESELQSLKMAAVDEAKYLQLAESLAGFRSKLRVRAEVLDIAVRQQILRLLVKEVLIGSDTITLRHSIPIPQSGPGSNGSPGPSSGVTGSRPNPSYLLRSGSHYDALRRVLPRAGGIRLIGSHGAEPAELEGLVFDTVRSIVENWPQPPDPIRGRSWSDLLRLENVHIRRGNRSILRALIRKVAGPEGSALTRFQSAGPVVAVTPIPSGDRRAVVLRVLGAPQLLYRTESTGKVRERRDRVHVYVDVSGSIGDLKGALYGAVLDCRDVVHPAVHLFSTVVHDVSFGGLRNGDCRTTGGTSIECVADHIQKHGVRRAVLLTDGWVGRPGAGAARALAAVHLGVALTPDADRSDLKQFVRHWAELETGK